MTMTTSIILFFSMLVLALIPGPGVLIVTARSTTAGFRHGISTSIGVVAADFVFITFALLGLTALSSALGELFIVFKYIGAAYLIWLGLSLMISKSNRDSAKKIAEPKHGASFAAGFITTLSNPKAILFYLSFFPAFLDLASVTVFDAVLLYLITTVAIGGVMLGYAFLAHKAKSMYSGSNSSRVLKKGSGVLLIGSGLYVAARS